MEMDEIGEVPVIRLDELTDEQRRAYMLVHNKLTMNTNFNLAMLELELDDINIDMTEYGFYTEDFDVDSFFTDTEDNKDGMETDNTGTKKSSVLTAANGLKYKSISCWYTVKTMNW